MAQFVTALKAAHDVDGFRCRKPELAAWLQQVARQHQNKGMSRTWVLVDDSAPSRIIGFYAVSMRGLVSTSVLPSNMARRLPRDVPAYTLARLAVALGEERKGAGSDLLMNAMDRARVAAMAVGGYALFVDAKDDEAVSFYTQYGFVPVRPPLFSS